MTFLGTLGHYGHYDRRMVGGFELKLHMVVPYLNRVSIGRFDNILATYGLKCWQPCSLHN